MNRMFDSAQRLALAAVVAALAISLLLAGAGVRPAPADVSDLELPDLDQELPTKVAARKLPDGYAIGFDSAVTNEGPGALRVTGSRAPGEPFMVADQLIRTRAGTLVRLPSVGRLEYVDAFGHEHWHFMEFQRYELYSVADPSRVLKDRKQGFCLADTYAPDWCEKGDRERTSIDEGLSPGKTDAYHGFVEGQEIVVDRTSAPSGKYILTNRTDLVRDGAVNPLREVTLQNNAASVLIEMTWPDSGSGTPKVKVLRKCPDTWDCPAGSVPPAALAAPAPPPPPPAASAPLPPRVAAVLTRRNATVLSRRALQGALPGVPRTLVIRCARRVASSFVCRARWRRSGARYATRVLVWRGRHGIYYRLRLTRRLVNCDAALEGCTRLVRRRGRVPA